MRLFGKNVMYFLSHVLQEKKKISFYIVREQDQELRFIAQDTLGRQLHWSKYDRAPQSCGMAMPYLHSIFSILYPVTCIQCLYVE